MLAKKFLCFTSIWSSKLDVLKIVELCTKNGSSAFLSLVRHGLPLLSSRGIWRSLNELDTFMSKQFKEILTILKVFGSHILTLKFRLISFKKHERFIENFFQRLKTLKYGSHLPDLKLKMQDKLRMQDKSLKKRMNILKI